MSGLFPHNAFFKPAECVYTCLTFVVTAHKPLGFHITFCHVQGPLGKITNAGMALMTVTRNAGIAFSVGLVLFLWGWHRVFQKCLGFD